jgi:HEAT repeat protein
VRTGDSFKGEVSILAGSPEKTADISTFLRKAYDPIAGLREPNAVDRYAAAKSLPYRKDLLSAAVPALESLLKTETEERVALEAAGASATLGSKLGQDYIGKVLWGDGRKDLRMEAVLILTELGSPFARSELVQLASDAKLAGDEIRQAAVWGLGKTGLKAYDQILPFIGDTDENLALHAITAFGSDTPEGVIRQLVSELITGDSRRASAASETLRLIANDAVVKCLIEAAASGHDWVLATLGRLPAALVTPAITGSELMKRIAPMLLMGEGANWLASEDRVMDIAFLTKQNL